VPVECCADGASLSPPIHQENRAVRYTIRHTFDVDADTFWGKLFFDPEYNKALFQDYLKFNTYRVLELEQRPDGGVHRRVECAPPVELPAVVKKAIGDNTSYVEDGRFDPSTRRFTVEVIPKLAADKIKTRVTLYTEARGPKRIERIVEIDSNVKVMFVGGVLEAFIEKQTRSTYDAAAEFTVRWIADKGL
jgi:hypothetical protein